MAYATSFLISICFISILCISLGRVYGRNCDELGVSLYESFGCTPVSHDDNGCPSAYDCNFPKEKDTCFFNGKHYKEGETIGPQGATCNGLCTCNASPQGAKFDCLPVKCNMTNLNDEDLEPGCYRLYELGNCCPVGKRCRGRDEIFICDVDGDVYDEGTGFHAKNSCEYCTCTRSKGALCQATTCGENAQLFQADAIRNNCAPVYLNDVNYPKGLLCCTHTFHCPTGTEVIEKSEELNPDAQMPEDSDVMGRNCDELGVTLYESFGCTPVSHDDTGCPSAYDCNFPKDKDICFFNGKHYKDGETVTPHGAPCNGQCTCNVKSQGASFSCHGPNCNRTNLDDAHLDPGCYRFYEPGNCCAIGKRCRGKDEIHKCVVDGEEYDEGTGFQAKNKCQYCTCSRSGPVCHATACAEWAQLFLGDAIRNHCASVYLEDGSYPKGLLCCTHMFHCPSGKEVIERSQKPNPDGKSCRFGEQTLNFGDRFQTVVGLPPAVTWHVDCECVLPPLVTCTERKMVEETSTVNEQIGKKS